MNIEGKVLFISYESNLAAVDIGWGEAIVLDLQGVKNISLGDKLESLSRSYGRISCFNRSKKEHQEVTVLSGSLPIESAKFVVTAELEVPEVA